MNAVSRIRVFLLVKMRILQIMHANILQKAEN